MRAALTALLALLGVAPGCTASDRDSSGPTSTSGANVRLDPPPEGSRALLARVLVVEAEVPVRAVLTLDDGSGPRTVEPPTLAASFSTAIPGFRPDREVTVDVELLDGSGHGVHSERITVDTEPLPALFPELELLTGAPDPSRGDTLFPVRGPDEGGFLVMVDHQGEPIWVLDGGGIWWRTVRHLDDGRVMLVGDHQVVITDWADAAPVEHEPPGGTEGYHHEAIPSPEGGFFAFTAGPLDVDDLPRGYGVACDPGEPATIWDSVVVEASADGTVVQTWSLGERLDTHRIGWDSLFMTPVGPDWGHANGMQYVEEHDAFVISMRNQDLVLELSRATGEIRWILSNPWSWDPAFEPLRLQPDAPDFRWTFHQHAPEWVDGRLLVFDNGAENDMPCGPADQQPTRTRAVEFEIDRDARTVRELWSWENGLFSAIMGDADRVAGGRVLATFGQLTEDEEGRDNAARGRGRWSSRLVEADPTTGTVAWDLDVYEADRGANPEGFRVPRSQRITTWWPGSAR